MNTFYHGDCLFVMKHDIEPESVDLIYLDPPFFTGKIQRGKWHPEAMEVSYEDSKRFWSEKADVMRQKAPAWLRHIAIKRPDFASYLYYMMERLQLCHTVLSRKGSIYLHCDWRASHYLKMVMDEIFDSEHYLNEIIWCYSQGGKSQNYFGRKHDSILYYSKGRPYTFNPDNIRLPYTPHKQSKTGTNYGGKMGVDENGRPYVEKWGTGKKKLYRYYLDKGKVPEDVWVDIQSIQAGAKERSGYPTQKPKTLLERIIKSSSNEGDLVLDPFCGCGTTVIVASQWNRKFIGIDIDTSNREKKTLPTAFTVIKNLSHELFEQAQYITRDISEVLEMDGWSFEAWGNEYYKATKPQPDRGVDGITQDGIPIQSKVYEIKYDKLSQFINDAKYHPKVPKPVKRIIAVSQTGFDDSARKLKFEVETNEGIEIMFKTPETMLELED